MRRFQNVVAVIVAPFIVAFSLTVAAASPVFIGEEFNFVATQLSSPGAGGTGTGTITIGIPTSGDFYTVSDASFISALKGCLTCTLLTQDLSGLFFDSATLGIIGTATGTYLGDLGGLHNFILIVTDAPTLTWNFTKHNQVTDITKQSNGTYYLAETPLPAALPLFATGLGALGLLGWRRKRKASAALAAA